jgi:bis(5'-nucleosyl)-tetraphosphatase (symmetrical)
LPRYAIGDIQGCYGPLRELLRKLDFSADRDQLLLVGDLVNRGPESLAVLRFVRSLGDNARTVLGNHDLHLLALHHDPDRRSRAGDTLDEVLGAPDREALLDWLIQQPLLIDDSIHGDLMVHAGVIPQWTRDDAIHCALEASRALRADPRGFLAAMYGNKPDRWQDAITAQQRHRFSINVLTRLRFCRADGTIDLKMKGAPGKTGEWLPWFQHQRMLADRRIIFGHWSALGLVQSAGLLALDTGCIWGGALTALDLDNPDARPVQIPCVACQQPDSQ